MFLTNWNGTLRMFAFKFARKSVLVKTKPFNRQTVISINQLFKVLSTGMNTCPQPWPSLINGLVDDALLHFKFVKSSYFKILQGSVATLFRWSWKILSYFVTNLSKTLRINFYQNRSSIVEVMVKNWCVFMPHSVVGDLWCAGLGDLLMKNLRFRDLSSNYEYWVNSNSVDSK